MFVLDALDQVRYKEPNKNCRLTAIFFAHTQKKQRMSSASFACIYKSRCTTPSAFFVFKLNRFYKNNVVKTKALFLCAVTKAYSPIALLLISNELSFLTVL